MKSLATLTVAACAMIALSAGSARAQHDSTHKMVITSSGDIEWVGPLGYKLRPGGAPIYCNENDVEEVRKVTIKSEMYREGMITPDQAKALALCAVPGQIGSGEMDSSCAFSQLCRTFSLNSVAAESGLGRLRATGWGLLLG